MTEIEHTPTTPPLEVRRCQHLFQLKFPEVQCSTNSFMLQPAHIAMYKPHYQYQALQKNHDIRILTLDPGQQDDLLTGTLQVVPIDSAGSYEAVSYVRADPGPAKCIYEILIRSDDGNEGYLMLRGARYLGLFVVCAFWNGHVGSGLTSVA